MHENFENSIRNIIIPPGGKIKRDVFEGFSTIIQIFLVVKTILELQIRFKKEFAKLVQAFLSHALTNTFLCDAFLFYRLQYNNRSLLESLIRSDHS